MWILCTLFFQTTLPPPRALRGTARKEPHTLTENGKSRSPAEDQRGMRPTLTLPFFLINELLLGKGRMILTLLFTPGSFRILDTCSTWIPSHGKHSHRKEASELPKHRATLIFRTFLSRCQWNLLFVAVTREPFTSRVLAGEEASPSSEARFGRSPSNQEEGHTEPR